MQNIIAGNWKLKGTKELASNYNNFFNNNRVSNCQVIVCPTFDLLPEVQSLNAIKGISIGAQDFFHSESTHNQGLGEPEQLIEHAVEYVILGHSDRRNKCSETSKLVYKKVNITWELGLIPIVCIGEKKEERDAERTIEVVHQQIKESIDLGQSNSSLIVAYEPVWAIGTGVTPTFEQIQTVHDSIRNLLTQELGQVGRRIPILYGGSADPNNATQILGVDNVNGLLVGGASLNIDSFGKMVHTGSKI
ncbi:MAG: triose-phosphate isomerase [Rhodobacteraceae bacterium]|nr:triose-phosphate isomerase [Paracoccaceae bacterium]